MRNSSKRPQSRNGGKEKPPPDAPFTIAQFCEWAGISVRQYYVQRKAGLGPRELRMGYRTIRIARDEAHAWAKRLTEREAAR